MSSQFSRSLLMAFFPSNATIFKCELLNCGFTVPSQTMWKKTTRRRPFPVYLFAWNAFLAEPGVSSPSPNLSQRPRLHQSKSGLPGQSVAPLQSKHTHRPELEVCCAKGYHPPRNSKARSSRATKGPGRADNLAWEESGSHKIILSLMLKCQT